jgi:hypothetical protein
MSRGLTTAQQAAAEGPHCTAAQIIDAVFDSGTLRFSTAGHDITVGANTYYASNKLRSIEALNESQDSTEGLRITLDAVDAGILAIIAGEPYRGRALNLYEVYLDASYIAIGAPVLQFPGLIASIVPSEQEGQATIVLEAEHFEKELRRPREVRFNDADQQSVYAGDRGCEYADQMTELQLVWPTKEAMRR